MISVIILILVIIGGFVWAFILASRKDRENAIIYRAGDKELDNYLERINNCFDSEELKKIYQEILVNRKVFKELDDDEVLRFVDPRLRNKMNNIRLIYTIKIVTINHFTNVV